MSSLKVMENFNLMHVTYKNAQKHTGKNLKCFVLNIKMSCHIYINKENKDNNIHGSENKTQKLC